MNLLPGTVGFTTIKGFTGWWVNLGQALLGDSCRYTHVFIVLHDNLLLEAMPGGARLRFITQTDIDSSVFYDFPLKFTEVLELTSSALELAGTKYGFSAYLNLALVRFGVRFKFLKRYLVSNDRLICSQLVDELLHRVGYHVFKDGRLSHEVTPGDLWYAAVEQGRRIT